MKIELGLLKIQIQNTFVKSICVITNAFILQTIQSTGINAAVALLIQSHPDCLLSYTRMDLPTFYHKYKTLHLLTTFPPRGLIANQQESPSVRQAHITARMKPTLQQLLLAWT